MIEYRTAAGSAEASQDRLTGLVTPFGVETTIGDLKRGGFHEQIAPGAFTKTLQERDVVLLFNHNSDMPLARTSAGNLKLEQAKDGLRADATPVQTSYGKDLLELTRSGVVKGMSFGFEVIKDSWTDDEGRSSDQNVGTRRTIHEIKLHEVSAVTFPAYPTTSLAARDALGAGTIGILEARGATFEETRDDPDGDEISAIKQAIRYINAGSISDAIDVLTDCLAANGGSVGDGDGDADDDGAQSYEKKSDELWDEERDDAHESTFEERMLDYQPQVVATFDPSILEGEDDVQRMQDILKLAEIRLKF